MQASTFSPQSASPIQSFSDATRHVDIEKYRQLNASVDRYAFTQLSGNASSPLPPLQPDTVSYAKWPHTPGVYPYPSSSKAAQGTLLGQNRGLFEMSPPYATSSTPLYPLLEPVEANPTAIPLLSPIDSAPPPDTIVDSASPVPPPENPSVPSDPADPPPNTPLSSTVQENFSSCKSCGMDADDETSARSLTACFKVSRKALNAWVYKQECEWTPPKLQAMLLSIFVAVMFFLIMLTILKCSNVSPGTDQTSTRFLLVVFLFFLIFMTTEPGEFIEDAQKLLVFFLLATLLVICWRGYSAPESTGKRLGS